MGFSSAVAALPGQLKWTGTTERQTGSQAHSGTGAACELSGVLLRGEESAEGAAEASFLPVGGRGWLGRVALCVDSSGWEHARQAREN